MPSCTQFPAPRRGAPRLLAGALLALALQGCRSPEDHRAEADEQVYAILAQRRAELGVEGAFTIDPPPGSLRQRIEEARVGGGALQIEPLGLMECLDIAAENSREYQSRRERLYLAALDLTLERYRFQVQTTGELSALVSGFDDEAQTADLGGGLTVQKLLGSGAFIVGDIGLGFLRTISAGDDWDGGSTLSLSITQPLLRGFGADIVKEPLTQAERDVLYEVRDYERFRRTFAFDVASQVFRIAQQVDTLRNEQSNYESLVRLRERNEAFAEAGQMLELDVDQAEQDELRARTRLVSTEAALEGLYDDFKLTLGLPVESELRIRDEDLENLFGLSVPANELDAEQAIALALERRLDHLTVRDEVEDAARGLAIAEDDLRAALDFSGDIVFASDNDQPWDINWRESVWDASLNLDLPIDRLEERNAYRRAIIGFDAAKRAEQSSRDSVTADIRDALRELTSAREQQEIEANAVVLAERRVENASLNLEAGRTDTRDLLESQEDLVQAQNSAVRARVDFALALLALYRDMELLRVDADGVRVDTEPLQQRDEP